MSLPQRIDPTSVEVTGRDIPWKRFGSCEGFVYKILDVDVERRTVDMVFHFEPSGMCFYHRHSFRGREPGARRRALHPRDRTPAGPDGTRSARPARWRSAPTGTRTPRRRPDGRIVYFSFRGDHDHIYDILDDNLELVREVSIQDFRTAFERW